MVWGINLELLTYQTHTAQFYGTLQSLDPLSLLLLLVSDTGQVTIVMPGPTTVTPAAWSTPVLALRDSHTLP